MIIDVLTLFPEMLTGSFDSSILQRAQKSKFVELHAHQLRDYARNKHKTVDDRPFGGGPGMLLKCEPLVDAIETLKNKEDTAKVIYLTPEGRLFNQTIAQELSQEKRLILISGHYEGIDERVRENWVDDEISIGDYILTNGTIASLVIIDAVVRLLPGVLGNEQSAHHDSFSAEGILEGPHYTRPAEFRGLKVPEELLSGNHAEIEKWRHQKALKRTQERRKDLIKQRKPS